MKVLDHDLRPHNKARVLVQYDSWVAADCQSPREEIPYTSALSNHCGGGGDTERDDAQASGRRNFTCGKLNGWTAGVNLLDSVDLR